MKRDVLILTALSTLLLLAGCSKSETRQDVSPDGVIRLRSGVRITVGSKAAGDAETFTAQVCGWHGAGMADPTAALTWHNEQPFKYTATAEAFDLNPLQYYHNDRVTVTTICAWYPAGIPENGLVSFQNTNGDLDVMCTQRVWGSLNNKISDALVFDHLTTQLCFLVVGDGWDPDEKITGITVRNVELPTGLILPTGGNESQAVLRKGTPASFNIRNFPSELIPTEQPAAAGDKVMIAPPGRKTLYVDVVTRIAGQEKRYENIPVTTSDANPFAAGTAYTATLTFSGTGAITIGSTIGEWTPGTSGGEVVD